MKNTLILKIYQKFVNSQINKIFGIYLIKDDFFKVSILNFEEKKTKCANKA